MLEDQHSLRHTSSYVIIEELPREHIIKSAPEYCLFVACHDHVQWARCRVTNVRNKGAASFHDLLRENSTCLVQCSVGYANIHSDAPGLLPEDDELITLARVHKTDRQKCTLEYSPNHFIISMFLENTALLHVLKSTFTYRIIFSPSITAHNLYMICLSHCTFRSGSPHNVVH